MCGICGFINLDGQAASSTIVERMNATLYHRGPDEGATRVHGAVALGHRRLSIVDLARGHQPMDLSGTPLTIVYNGEIYNHMALRKELLLPADEFHTTCDTETLLAAYGRYGADTLSHLRGMFAFAILDRDRQSLFMARDRLGVKPLYYYRSDRLFAFASEIKGLLAHPEIAAKLNVSQIPLQLSLKYTLDDQTLYAGIRKLLPGHSLRVDDQGTFEIRRYWDMKFSPKHKFASMDDAAVEFRERFHEAVRVRLMADVPLGVFLSGGIDSSVIAASMSQMVSEPIKAFSIAFAEREYNELQYSQAVARHIGADIREVVLTPERWFQAWPRMVYHEDEPIAHPSSIPLHFVSLRAKQDVKVVLTGEGADELLAGYERYYQTLTNLRYGRFVPNGLRKIARRLIDLLPDRSLPKRKGVRTSLYLPNDIESLFLDNYAAFSRAELEQVIRPSYRSSDLSGTYAPFMDLMQASGAEDLLDQLLYADMKTYLLELLMKQDQMSMSASIESRVPFLDHHLVEFACQLPIEYKLRGFETKRILRAGLGASVPHTIVTRSKKGFPTPIQEWFRGPYAQTMHELLLSDQSLSLEYFDRKQVAQILERHTSGRWNLQEQLWTLGNFEIWLRIALDGQDPATVMPPSLQSNLKEAEPCVSFG